MCGIRANLYVCEVLHTPLTPDILLREISSDDTPPSLSLSEISSGTLGLLQYLNKIGDLVWTTIDLPPMCLVFLLKSKTSYTHILKP